MEGNFFLISSALRWLAISRKAPPWGLPLPAFTSFRIARATTSRVKSSGGRRASLSPANHRAASSSVSAVSEAKRSGIFSNMNRCPSLFIRMPPSPRTPSVTSMPRTEGGQTIPVG